MSLPTVRCRWRHGELPGAYRDLRGRIRVPVTALDAIGDKRRSAPAGLSQRYVADALWVLRRVLGFARANGLFSPGIDPAPVTPLRPAPAAGTVEPEPARQAGGERRP